MATAQSSSDEAAQVSSVPLKRWAAELVQAFHDLTLCSSMTQYLIIHQRSIYNHWSVTSGKDFGIARRGL